MLLGFVVRKSLPCHLLFAAPMLSKYGNEVKSYCMMYKIM